jgi:hypothetical protein
LSHLQSKNNLECLPMSIISTPKLILSGKAYRGSTSEGSSLLRHKQTSVEVTDSDKHPSSLQSVINYSRKIGQSQLILPQSVTKKKKF